MTTYYRGPDVLVTSTGVRMGGRDYRLGDLAQVWHRRGRRAWGNVAGRGALVLAIITPVVIGAIGVLIALVIDASTTTTIVLAGGGVLIGLAALPLADVLLEFVDRSYDRGSHRLEIWARVDGADVLLLATTDKRRFGQIYRALQRAVDDDPTPSRAPEAR
ncbi:DUF6232 family protein [Amorphoplanes digitatis]|uniref:Fumarate reductase subunit D n=1 Tax=Actinoplanes digitatis TaxID=1868 RepID=A0A7W7HT61_9ACTN|nr:DUF6232 family protein [Actinoplanes digitatis]MBB4760233.1 fumarate reductase subunit D [Actinoplanes digitatis]BFE68319.1 hypothetical protein GCM10020092_016200 [Actinoplanes digitatis]GID94755.1 hypothetical protein Adi01nite_41670 [Actinoplanes digitatis]